MALKRAFLAFVAGCTLLALQSAALAQGTSGIKGVVLDKDGAPLPSARITVTNPTLGVMQAAVTDSKGEFRIAPLPPGKGYILKVEFPEMAAITQSEIELSPGRIINAPVTLRPSSEMREHVKVVGTGDVVNTESTTTQTTFSSEFIDSLPILGRNYQDILSLAPGVSDTDGDGNVNIHGARDTDVVTLVDGVSTVDPYSGKVGQQLNIDSIQEIEVKTSGASAEFSRAQGGFVNIVTKSGGNEFEGSFKFYWRSNILDGDGAGIDPPQLHGGLGEIGLRDLKFNDFSPFLSLGGPIKKDKAWYYFTAEYIQKQDPVNALTQAFVRGTKEKRIFGKLSWDVSTNHKLVFTATIDPQEYSNLGLDSFTAVEAGYTDKLGGTNLVLKETAIFNPNVFLETTLQHLVSSPQRIPTLNADTNGNGILYIDRNNNHFIDASERDPGQDFDRDGVWDVFEDINRNKNKDEGEDTDQDGRLTTAKGCEGETREDIDCDGRLDATNEDTNHNGRLDGNEDLDHDNYLDLGNEDRNHNFQLDDRPTPQTDDNVDHHLDNCDPNGPGGANCTKVSTNPYYYPYDRPRPLPRDRDLEQDQRTLRVNGPYNETQSAQWGRITLRQDLTVFVPNWFGQHDMKFGGIVEREHYNRDDSLRPFVFPNAQPAGSASINPTVGVQLPAENEVFNSANDTTFGMYVNDTYKPLPNLTLTLGVRFDRETTDSFGYTHFDPRAQRATFDKLSTLSGWERTLTDNTTGNNDGVTSQGYCADPIFFGLGGGQDACKSNSTGNQMLSDLNALRRIAQSRLTQHHIETSLAGTSLAQLFPDVQKDANGNLIFDRDLLRRQGFATFQEREPFRLTNNNLAPRFSLSWDPWGDSKTKVFANWSRFFDKLFLQTVTQEEGPDSIFRYYNADKDGVSGTGVPDNGFGAVITRAPPSATQVDRGLQTPFTDELSLGFERELAPEVSLKITYINRKFRQQLQDRDINHATRCCDPTTGRPFDVFGRINTGGGNQSGTAGQPVADFKPDLYIYNFFFNQIFRIGNFNHSRYHGLEVEVTKRLSRKWQLESSYTYSRARGNAESFQSFLGDDPATLHEEFGYLDFDMRHEVKFNAVTYLPGDWQLGSTLSWHSGLPYTVISTYLALDNFEYPQFRTLFGSIHRIPPGQPDPTNAGYAFFPERRNSRRNAAVYNINVEARKAFVLGKLNSKLFLTVENLLNTDDLEITYYEPAAPDRGGALQLISERRFGRRFEIGFQFEF